MPGEVSIHHRELIDRMDNVINICEMKHTTNNFEITKEYRASLERKLDVFQNETKTKKALHLTMICSNGLKHEGLDSIVVNEIDGDELFD